MQEVVGSTPIFSTFTEFKAFQNKAKFSKSIVKPANQRFAGFFVFGHLQNFQKRTKLLWHICGT
jgi:hypothetical protein